MPPNIKLWTRITKNQREIHIDNNFSRTTITIRSFSGAAEQRDVLGVLEPDPVNLNRYYSLNYFVDLKIEWVSGKQNSPEAGSHKTWHANLKEMLSRFDWAGVETEIHREMLRRAVTKIVDTTAEVDRPRESAESDN